MSGMEQIRSKVAGRLLEDRKRDRTGRRDSLLLRMHSEFKLALWKAAEKDDRSLNSFILKAVADKIKWEGRV